MSDEYSCKECGKNVTRLDDGTFKRDCIHNDALVLWNIKVTVYGEGHTKELTKLEKFLKAFINILLAKKNS